MLHELHFASFNGRDTVTGWIYVPAAEPEGIVQLVHGFGEHSRRYFHMIVALMDAGFIVCANDHVGHGATAIANGTWGDWEEDGKTITLWVYGLYEGETTMRIDLYDDAGEVLARRYILIRITPYSGNAVG